MPDEPLFPHVKYTDVHGMTPCPTTKITHVFNPCKTCYTDQDCVSIAICVPQHVCKCACECVCGCPVGQVKSRRDGTRVRCDYGDYAVDVRVKRGDIEVDYQD